MMDSEIIKKNFSLQARNLYREFDNSKEIFHCKKYKNNIIIMKNDFSYMKTIFLRPSTQILPQIL